MPAPNRLSYLVSLLLLAGGCSASADADRPTSTFTPAPPEVVASFEQFFGKHADSILSVATANGYHAGWEEEGDSAATFRWTPDISLSQLTPQEQEAEIYEATVMLHFHRHHQDMGGFAMPENVFMEFATQGPDGPWILLTDNGRIHSLVSEDGQADLPMDFHMGIRNVFEKRTEVAAWWAARCHLLAEADQLTDPKESELCAPLVGHGDAANQ